MEYLQLKTPEIRARNSGFNPILSRMWNFFLLLFALAKKRLPAIAGCASALLLVFHARA
ncbi:hypothetical protein [Mesorhizobium abyssinicae]|uniref:hypothetical protein n=1 Tax=Mesorhizobium abyssinicae TaxID=1209958 RepID=UPI003CF61948